MAPFTPKIVEILNVLFSSGDEYVESVTLASHGFNIRFVTFDIQCNERVFGLLNGLSYEWSESPTSGPWGLLGRQCATKASLKAPNLLSIAFDSGDSLDIESVDGPYESVLFNFPPQGKSFVMEIF